MNIKPNELRIGNVVLSYATNGNPNEWVEIEVNPQHIQTCFDHPEWFKPIQITEDRLLKFGWVWNAECKSFEKYPNGDARMNLQFREPSGSYTMFNYVLKALIAERIYHVHQLQNLYFALTGEELKTNEK